jgi:hypothetical protein
MHRDWLRKRVLVSEQVYGDLSRWIRVEWTFLSVWKDLRCSRPRKLIVTHTYRNRARHNFAHR